MNKREIKFRVWDKNEKTMINFEEIERIDFTDKTIIVGGYINFEDIEFMQYIGLKDKDGIEIYEGDILINTNKSKLNLGMDNQKYLVVYKALGFDLKSLFKGIALKFDYSDLKKIGNIYENPELLNEGGFV